MAGKKDKGSSIELTTKQRRFADMILSGDAPSLVAAYREVYECKGDTPKQKKSQTNEASRLWHHPGVRRYADEWRAKAEANRVRREVGERERVRQRLWNEADAAEKASDRINALRLLGQHAGMFTDKVEIKTDDVMSDAEVLAEIELALRNAVDVSASSSTNEPSKAEVPQDFLDDDPDGYLM